MATSDVAQQRIALRVGLTNRRPCARLGHAARVMGRLACLVLTLVLVLGAAACGGGGGGESADSLVADSVTATGAVKSFHLAIDTENVASSGSGLTLKFV